MTSQSDNEFRLVCTFKMNAPKTISDFFPWNTSNFIQNIIKKSEQSENVALKSFTAKKCFDGGESFSSYMFALTVLFIDECGNEKQSDFILKIGLRTEDYIQMCEECFIYEKEIETYTKILPAIQSALESAGASRRIAPKYN